jgi:cell division protein FtsB
VSVKKMPSGKLDQSSSQRRPSAPKRRGRTRAVVRWLLLAFAVVIFVDMLVGDQGLMAMFETERRRNELTADIARQQAENAGLAEQVRRLNDDPAIIEELARELGLIKPGEKVFILKNLPSPSQ